MIRLKVLITTSYYWPEESGSAPYLTGLAEDLAERGHDVIVTTGFAHYPDWKSSAGGRFARSETQRGVKIRRRWHYVPRAQSAVHRAAYEASLFGLGATACPVRWRPNVVVGTCPSLAGGALAKLASEIYDAPYGLVFQDLMGLAAAQSGVAGGRHVARVVRAMELRLAQGAGAVGIIGEGFRQYLVQGGVDPQRIRRLRNWTRRTEPAETAAETRDRFGWGRDEFVCVHGGNIGHKQALDNLLETAALLRGENVRIALVGDGNDRARLQRRAHDLTLENVQFLPMQGPGRWEETMQAADVLLVNQRASVTDMSLPSKLTSYFAAGRPVIAAASAGSETAAEIEAAGGGVVVAPGDPAAFRDAIVALKDDRSCVAAFATSTGAYAASVLSRSVILGEYEQFVRELVENRPRTAPRAAGRSAAFSRS